MKRTNHVRVWYPGNQMGDTFIMAFLPRVGETFEVSIGTFTVVKVIHTPEENSFFNAHVYVEKKK